MTERIIGPTGSRRRRRWLLAPVLMVALAALFLVAGAQAVHDDNLFELGPAQGADILGDGNTANGPDWGDLFNASGGSTGNLFGGLAATFINDDTSEKGNVDRTTFSGAGGSNKNNDAISNADCAARTPPLTGSACDLWHWDTGNVPAKDDLVNSYVYATQLSNGHLILYGGLERLDESGDSHIDFEFLQNPINIVDETVKGEAGIPCNDPGNDPVPCEFTGVRTFNDVIISMDFVTGGALGSVTVRRWNGSEYELEGTAGGEGCNVADTICAFNNGAPIDGGPWPNFDKTGNEVTQLATNAFTELGVDVTALLGTTPCISTVMGKTRSAQSFTAELKDFSAPKSFPICGAQIGIAPDDVNEVGVSHTFTVTVSQKIGNTTVPAPDGTKPTVTLTTANGAGVSNKTDNCATPGTVNGTCTVTFTSNTPGTVTGHASATFSIGGVSFSVETDGKGGNTGDAVKTYVDAFITIGSNATNGIGENHTFTVTVKQNDGSGATYTNAPDGTKPTVTLTPSGGATVSGVTNNCATAGTVNGTCTVTFTSNAAGTVTGHASVTFSVKGVSLTRSTNGVSPNSADAVKIFIAGSLIWFKDDNAGTAQGGATFDVCRTADRFGNAVTGECVSVADDTDGVVGPGLDQDPAAGKFKLINLKLGHYTVKETIAPPGFDPDPSTKSADLTLAAPDATISVHFVNLRPILKITGFGYTNAATGTPTNGVGSGTVVYTVNLHNYGGAPLTLTNSTLVVNANATCTGGNTKTITGTILAGADGGPFTLNCAYTNLADGAVVSATLTVKYTENTLERQASGSPATISFTIQRD